MVCTSHPYRLHGRRDSRKHPGPFSADRTLISWSVFNERQHSLTPGDLHEQLDSIRKLTREALKSYEPNGLNLTLHYAPDALERVRAMVAGEQQCCAFL